MTTEQELIDQLNSTADYKVIRRLKPVDQYNEDTGAQKQNLGPTSTPRRRV